MEGPKTTQFGSATTAQTGNPSTQSTQNRQATIPTLGQASAGPTQNARSAPAAGFTGVLVMTADTATHVSANPLPAPIEEAVRIDVETNNFKPIARAGFSEQRPEILASFTLEPVYDDQDANPGPVGDMLDFQISARQLRAENVARLINELKSNDATKQTISTLEASLDDADQQASADVQFVSDMVNVLSKGRSALQVKMNDQRVKDDITSRRNRLFGQASGVKGIADVMTTELQFTEDGFRSFSNTKVLATLLDDVRNMAVGFSPGLFDAHIQGRADDRDLTTLVKLDDVSGQSVRFDMSNITTGRVNDVSQGASAASFRDFLQAFDKAGSQDDRLKLLLHVLSKELRVSSGLGIESVKSSLTRGFGLNSTEGDIFSAIFGLFSSDSLQPAQRFANSIGSLLRITTTDGTAVLPFESEFIKAGLGQDYVPGSEFYVNSIVRGAKKFDVSSFDNFTKRFDSAVSAMSLIMEATLDINVLNGQTVGLGGSDILTSVISSMFPVATNLTPRNAATDVDIIGPALLREAQTDVELKHYLYMFLLLVGLSSSTNGSSSSIKAFDTLHRAGLTSDVVLAEVSRLSSQTDQTGKTLAEQLFVGALLTGTQVRSFTAFANPVDAAINLISLHIADKFSIRDAAPPPRVPDWTNTSSQSPPRDTGFTVSIDDLKLYLTAVASSDAFSILSAVISTFNSFDTLARKAITGTPAGSNTDDYFSNTSTGLTKFNFLGAHNIFRMFLDLFCTIASKYPLAKMQPTHTTGVSITTDADDIKAVAQGFNVVLHPNALLTDVLFSQQQRDTIRRVWSELLAISSKLSAEDDVVRDIVDVLISLNNVMKSSAQDVVRFFSPQGSNKDQMAAIVKTVDADDKLSTLSEAQVSLARASLTEYQAARASSIVVSSNDDIQASGASPFIDGSTVIPGVRNALFDMLRKPEFSSKKGGNAQLISVGLPAGFGAAQHDRLSTFTVGEDLKEFSRRTQLRDDIVRVNVYMQDHILDDVVFKPLTFIFQTGRFVSSLGFSSILDSQSFDDVVKGTTTNVLAVDKSSFVDEVGDVNGGNIAYSFLSDEERVQMLSNHIMSYLFEVYVKLLTGIELAEDRFLLNPDVAVMLIDDATQKQFIQLLTTHISGIAGKKLTLDDLRGKSVEVDNLLTRLDASVQTKGVVQAIGAVIDDSSKAKNIEIAQDLLTFIDMFSPSSLIFGAGARKQRVVSPKMFERIFNIIIDPDDFEVDVQKTKATSSGRSLLGSQAMNKTLSSDNSTLGSLTSQGQQVAPSAVLSVSTSARKQLGNVSLRSFFVTVEQLPALSALDVQSRVPRVASSNSDPPTVQTNVQKNMPGLEDVSASTSSRVKTDRTLKGNITIL